MFIQREDVVSSLFCLAQVTCKQARGFPTFIRRITIIHRIDCNMPFLVSGICCSCNEPVEITPAHAGLTCLFCILSRFFWDHPRACGAYLSMFSIFSMILGSPPRMRGLPVTFERLCSTLGITPAHAGLTFGLYRQKHSFRDHPRACGAYTAVMVRARLVMGITPAHAGLT